MVSFDTEQCINNNKHIVLFDGVCNLCSGWVQFLIKRDPNAEIKFCSVQSAEGRALLQSLGLNPENIETMVYIRSGKAFFESTAFLEIAKKLPAAWSVLSAGLWVPAIIRNGMYRAIARNRYRIAGKKTQCLIPSEELKSRFIEWNTTCH